MNNKAVNKILFYKSGKVKAAILILFALIIELGSSIIYWKINPALSFLEILYYSSQILSSIFVISGVVIAVWQYYLSSKSVQTDLALQQVQRAIDLSEYYKDNILKYIPAIIYIFDEVGATPILNKLTLSQLNDFDKHELEDLLTSDDINFLKNSQYKDTFYNAVVEANAIYNLHMEFTTSVMKHEEDGQTVNTVAIAKNSIAVSFFSDLLNNILNNMEYFALHFSHNTADESVVYQSLHQSYFELILLMYYYISIQNDNPSFKYYTNVIALFHNWRREKDKQKEDLSRQSSLIQRTGTKINH